VAADAEVLQLSSWGMKQAVAPAAMSQVFDHQEVDEAAGIDPE
jgi:hypothetical protein